MKAWLLLPALASLVCSSPAGAKGGPIAFDMPGLEAAETIRITSSAFASDGAIPKRYSAYDQDISLPLAWTPGPVGTASFALVIQDPDAPPAQPVIHWIAWNIPPTITILPPGLPTPAGGPLVEMKQGRNSHDAVGYFGPRPPANDPAHHDHVQIFALDRRLDLAQGGSLDALLADMKGHVLARGEIVGTFAWPQP